MRFQLFGDREPGVADDVDARSVERLPDSDAAFWASPVGRAARARMRGDRFFQIELDDATLTAYAETAALTGGGRRVRRTCDLLGQIEELGWHLEHVSWWRVDQSDPAERDRPARPEPHVEHVRGIYLFHSVPAQDTEETVPSASSHGDEHAPTHRRDVS